MKQDVISCSVVCSFAPPSQAAIETIPRLYVSKWNRPTPVRSQINLTHAGLGKLNLGGVGLTSLINTRSREAFSRYSMLRSYSGHCAVLVG